MKTLPAGPKGTLVGGCAEDLKQDPLGFLEGCHEEYGNLWGFRIGPFPCLFVNEPDLIHEVLVAQAGNFTKDAALRNNREFFGHGLLSSEGELWKRQRKLASPAFSPRRLEAYGEVMVEHTQKMLSRWQDDQTFDMQHEMMELTLAIAAKTLFDADLAEGNDELEDALTKAQQYLAERMNDPLMLMLPEWVPFPTNVHLHEAIQKVDQVVYRLIEERRGKAEGRNDFLSILMTARDEDDGKSMSDQLIRDEVFTLFFAGHETTALTLAWTLYLLSQHLAIEERLVKEVDEVLGDRPPAASDFARLQFTQKVVTESLRIRPPVWAIGREAGGDCVIGDYPVSKGTAVIISQWVMHHDERFYSEPHRFDPERWTDDFWKDLPKFAYFPFGGGPRTCIGNSFAMLEATLALAAIMQEYRFTLAPEPPVELVPAVTLRFKNGVKMTAHRRHKA